MRLSTKHQILIGCGAALVILILLTQIAYRTANTVWESGGLATRTQQVLLVSESLSSQLDDADRALREMVASDAPGAWETYRTATSRIGENIELLRGYWSPDLPHLERFNSVDTLIQSKLASMDGLVGTLGTGRSAYEGALETSEFLTRQLHTEVQQLQRSELEYLATQSIEESIRGRRTQSSILLVSLGALVFLTVGAALIILDLEGRRRAETNLMASEERFRTLAANAPIGIYLTHADGQLEFVNDRYAAITGIGTRDVEGRTWAEGLHPDDRESASGGWRKCARDGEDFDSEHRIVRPDGRVVWIHERSTALRDPHGGISGTVGTITDVTGRKMAEAERDRFFSLSLDMLSMSDFRGSLRRVNPAWSERLGYSEDELTNRPLIDLVHPDDRESTETEWARLMHGGVISRFENRVRTRQGSYRWLSWNAAADQDSQLIYSTARDVTDSRELQDILREKNRELERQNEEIAQATRKKTEFLANMSHELRTPLKGIIGFAELMKDGHAGEVTEAHAEFLEDIVTNSGHLLELINDIMDLARIEAGSLRFHPEELSLRDVAGEVHRSLSDMAAENEITLTVDVPPSIPTLVLDPVRLKQVLQNYVSNAIKFTDPGGRVWIRAKSTSNGSVRLEVEDTGIGVQPENIDKLFSEFQQLDGSASRKYKGTGLGLALTRRIVEAQGGSVGVSSLPGRGSIFHAVLPVDQRSASHADTTPDGEREVDLLIVEGTRQLAGNLVDILRENSFSSRVVARGAEAMEVIANGRFRGILLDLHLPDMDGRKLLEEIRTSDHGRGTPVVVITTPGDRRQIADLHIQGFIEKPVDFTQIMESLRRAGLAEAVPARAAHDEIRQI